MALNCLTLTVNGLTNSIKRCRLATFLVNVYAKIVCLQETHLRDTETQYLREVFKGKIYHAPAVRRSKGVMIGTSKDIPWELKEIISEENGHFLILKGKLYQMELCLVGIYVPSGSQSFFWQQVFSRLQLGGELIVLGDFNAVMDTILDRSGTTATQDLSHQFKTYMREFRLLDAWREKYGAKRDYTYYSF